MRLEELLESERKKAGDQILNLVACMMEDGRMDDISKLYHDRAFLSEMQEKYHRTESQIIT